MVQRTAFRAAPVVITVRPGPATERARARAEARAREISPAMTAEIAKTAARSRPVRRELTSSGGVRAWTGFAIFALGTLASAVAQLVTEKGAELAVLAAVVAGVATLSALSRGDAGKPRTRMSQRG